MAELVLKVGDSLNPKGYEDGDIMLAFNDRRILHVHSEHACSPRLHPDRSPREGGFRLLVRGTLFEDFSAITHRYRFERISRREVRRVDLITLDEEILSDVPRLLDGKTLHINVALWIERRLKSDRHKIFGTAGAEVWYSKSRKAGPDLLSLDNLWLRIESETPQLKSEHTHYPMSPVLLAKHLHIAHEDFDNDKQIELTEPIMDETDPDPTQWVTIKKRKNHIDYKKIWPSRNKDIKDKSKVVDLRSEVARTQADIKVKVI